MDAAALASALATDRACVSCSVCHTLDEMYQTQACQVPIKKSRIVQRDLSSIFVTIFRKKHH